MPENTSDRTDIIGRVGRLEGAVDGIKSELTIISRAHETTRELMIQQFAGVTQQFSVMNEKLSTAGKPSGQTIAAYIGIASTLLLAAGSLIAFLFSNHSNEIGKIQIAVTKMTELEHADSVSVVGAIKEMKGEMGAQITHLRESVTRLQTHQDEQTRQLNQIWLERTKIQGNPPEKQP